MRLSSFLFLSLVFAVPANAAETDWQQIAPDVSVRLISAGTIDASGVGLFALELDMPEGTKTYWRIPGETGLPLELDFSASSGVTGHVVHWPYPLRETKAGYTDYVYYGHTVLPLEISFSNPSAAVDVVATMGVCSEICIPAQAQLQLPLDGMTADPASGLRIRQALAEVPIAWDEANEPLGRVGAVEDAIAVQIKGDDFDSGSLIAATAEGELLFGAPQKSPQQNLVLLPILGKSDNSALHGVDVELTFMTDRGAYFLNRTIEDIDAVRTIVRPES